MAIKFFKTSSLPSSPSSNDDGIWFVKPAGSNPMKIFLIHNGTSVSLDAVDAATLAAALLVKADDNAVVKLSGNQTISGAKTFNLPPKVSANATSGDEVVRKSQMDSLLANKADDNAVVKLSGNQSISGTKTFSTPARFGADASHGNDGVRKSQLDTLLNAINNTISDLESAIVDGLAPPTDIDCSTNPNYPAAEPNDRFIVSEDGKIGGSSGVDVTVGDLIVCRTATSGGTHATAGDKFYILQTNVHDATTTVKGYIQIATEAEVDAGGNNSKAVTPKTLSSRLDKLESSISAALLSTTEGRYVRYDSSQSLTSSQKDQARNNMGAAADADVVKLSGNQTITGLKIFSTSVRVPAGSGPEDAVNKGQLDTKADDNAVVKTSGNQTVAGKKTFSTVPASTQDASAGNDLVRFSQAQAMMSSAILEWTTDNWS